jgi:hypothetical protein
MKRRKFITTIATSAGITILPRHVLGGSGYTAPSDRLNVDCRGGKKARCTFESAAPVTEALCLGMISMQTGKKLVWDPVTMTTDMEEANKLIKPYYRPGWEL